MRGSRIRVPFYIKSKMQIADCPVKTAIDVIGGKWKPMILFALKSGTLRFGELRRQVPGATHKVLTEQLRQLEESQIIDRLVIQDKQVHTEYSLSDYSATLRPILEMLANWGALHRRRCALKGDTVVRQETETESVSSR